MDMRTCEELLVAGIPISAYGGIDHEPFYLGFVGELHGWTFHNSGRGYWMAAPSDRANGLPLEFADPLYVGYGQFVRTAGHCGCPPPHEWACYFDAHGKQVILDPKGEQRKQFTRMHLDSSKLRFVASMDEVLDGTAVITSYHIDTQLGLKAFADTLKEWKAN